MSSSRASSWPGPGTTPGEAGALPALEAAGILAARLLLAALFVVEGWLKLTSYRAIVGYMEANGVPGALLPFVILTELGGGLMVAVGLFTRAAALALAGFCLLTALLFHSVLEQSEQLIHFGKNLGLAGGFLLLALHGGGRWSLDGRRR